MRRDMQRRLGWILAAVCTVGAVTGGEAAQTPKNYGSIEIQYTAKCPNIDLHGYVVDNSKGGLKIVDDLLLAIKLPGTVSKLVFRFNETNAKLFAENGIFVFGIQESKNNDCTANVRGADVASNISFSPVKLTIRGDEKLNVKGVADGVALKELRMCQINKLNNDVIDGYISIENNGSDETIHVKGDNYVSYRVQKTECSSAIVYRSDSVIPPAAASQPAPPTIPTVPAAPPSPVQPNQSMKAIDPQIISRIEGGIVALNIALDSARADGAFDMNGRVFYMMVGVCIIVLIFVISLFIIYSRYRSMMAYVSKHLSAIDNNIRALQGKVANLHAPSLDTADLEQIKSASRELLEEMKSIRRENSLVMLSIREILQRGAAGQRPTPHASPARTSNTISTPSSAMTTLPVRDEHHNIEAALGLEPDFYRNLQAALLNRDTAEEWLEACAGRYIIQPFDRKSDTEPSLSVLPSHAAPMEKTDFWAIKRIDGRDSRVLLVLSFYSILTRSKLLAGGGRAEEMWIGRLFTFQPMDIMDLWTQQGAVMLEQADGTLLCQRQGILAVPKNY